MSEKITTKDLQGLNELMNFENWMANKLKNYSERVECENLKSLFEQMTKTHFEQHEAMLQYLAGNAK